MLLEVCAYNIVSCKIAEASGASRIELCADPTAGGTTPSIGLITYCLQQLRIPVYPMIRPRGGNFVFDNDELAIMQRNIRICKDVGCKGIATGVQLPDQRINTEQLKRIVGWAYPMEVTCHKVFDRVPDPRAALEDVISAGCKRILTSGLQKTAVEGIDLLKELAAQAAGRILIMPGGGVRASNIATLAKGVGVQEFHSSGILPGDTTYTADAAEIHEMVAQLRLLRL